MGGFYMAKTIGRILKYTVFALILFVYVFLMFRMCGVSDSKTMSEFIWNEESVTAYNNNPGSFKITIVNKKDSALTSDGKFAVSNIHITGTGQIQFTIRYNNSTVKQIIKDYKLETEPVGEPFIYILTNTNTGETFRSYQYVAEKKLIYNYRKIIFDGIDLNEKNYCVDIYYCADVNFNKAPYGTLPLIFAISEEVEISKTPVKDNRLMVNPVYPIKN